METKADPKFEAKLKNENELDNEIEAAHVKSEVTLTTEMELSNDVDFKTEVKLEYEAEPKFQVEPSSNIIKVRSIPKSIFRNTIQELLNPETQTMDTAAANLPPRPRQRLIVTLNLPSMRRTSQPAANPTNAQSASNSATKTLITSANLAQQLPKAHLLQCTIPQLRSRLYHEHREHLPSAQQLRKDRGMMGVVDWPVPGHEGESEEYGNIVVTCEVIKERVKQLKAALREKLKEVKEKHKTWSDLEYILRFETGDMDYEHFVHRHEIVNLHNTYERIYQGTQVQAPSQLLLAAAAAHVCLGWEHRPGQHDGICAPHF